MSIVTLGGMNSPGGSALISVFMSVNVSTWEYSIHSIPFITLIAALIAVSVFVPGLVLWLPNLAFG